MSAPLSCPVIVGLQSAPDTGHRYPSKEIGLMYFLAIVSGLRRVSTGAACALVALMLRCAPAAAQDWMEYAYPDLAFSVAFPAEPKVEMTTYQGPDGGAFEARIYSVTRDTGLFKL